MPIPYRRRQGDRITYGVQSTIRYKSSWQRWNRGRRLRDYQSVSQAGSTIYARFPSRRSPVGYWDTVVDLGNSSGGVSVGGGGDCPPSDLSPYSRFRVINYEYVYDKTHTDTDSNGVDYTYDDVGTLSIAEGSWYTLSPGDRLVTHVVRSGEANEIEPYTLANSEVTQVRKTWGSWTILRVENDAGFRYNVRAGARVIYPDPGALIRMEYIKSLSPSIPDGPPQNVQLTAAVTVSFQLEFEPSDPLQPNHVCTYGRSTDVDVSNCSGSIGFCNCPDYTHEHGPIPGAIHPSLHQVRSWVSSNADGAHAQPPSWCKHIYALVIHQCLHGNAAAVEPPRGDTAINYETPWGARSADDPVGGWGQWLSDRRRRRRDNWRNIASDRHTFRHAFIDWQTSTAIRDARDTERAIAEFEDSLDRYGIDYSWGDLNSAEQQMAREYGLTIYGMPED